MKRFLCICSIVFFIMLSVFDKNINKNDIKKDESYFTRVDNKNIQIYKENKWEDINIVGVNFNSSKPGTFPLENKVTEKEYIRWIGYIYDMGANTIKVPNLMSEHFYNALDKFNEGKKNPIYLMQGIYLDETYLKDGYDLQSNTLEDIFKKNIKLIIDSVHGNPYNYDKPDILQVYKTDVSKYLIGYTLGIELANHDLIYTEIMNEEKNYNGKYLYTDNESSSAESFMAKMGDYLIDYEWDNYKTQSLLNFIGSSSQHIKSSRYNPNDKNILLKDDEVGTYKDYIDIKNIKYKSSLKTGVTVSYNIYPTYEQLRGYKENLDELFMKIDNYHDIPVMISEFGIPSSRLSNDIYNEKIGYINEQQQGEMLVDIYRSIKKSNISGSFIFEFQDSWHNSSYNTKDLKILDRSPYFSDPQTFSQSFGLMAFDPGEEKSICYVDDNIDEWTKEDIITSEEGFNLSIKSDEKYLYLMLKSEKDINLKEEDIYIGIDTTNNSGTKKSSKFDLEFDKPIDFLINIPNKMDSRIMVHEYYNTFKFNEDKKDNKKRPDLIKLKKDIDKLSPIYMEVSKRMYIEETNTFKEKVVYETGKLNHGNSNPKSDNYDSISDFYVGDKFVELRIPWLLLNFMDPSTKQIQDDLYEKFKVVPTIIKDINIEASIVSKEETIKLKSSKYRLKSWVNPTYHERLKSSYYMIKDEIIK